MAVFKVLAMAIILTAVSNLTEQSCVSVDNGALSVDESCNCMIKNNGKEINDTKGLHYGLIQYSCDKEDGTLVSKLSCKNCGLYCVQNDLILECQNVTLQVSMGVLVGLFIGGMLSAFISWLLSHGVKRIMKEHMIRRQMKADAKENKACQLVSRMTGVDAKPTYKQLHNFKPKHTPRAHSKRTKDAEVDDYIKLAKMMRNKKSMDALVNTTTDECETDQESSVPSTSGVSPSGSRGGRPKTVLLPLPVMMCLMLLGAEACDMSFYFRNDGKICTKTDCHDIKMYSFPLSYGKVVCFRDSDDQVTEFKISDAYNRIRYNKMYYTGEYRVEVDSIWKCEGTDYCKKEDCRAGVDIGVFKSHELSYASCETSASPCDSYCYWGTQCIYYKYFVNRPETMYPVYRMVSTIWEIVVTTTREGIETRSVLNVNNPTVNIITIESGKKVTIPMVASNVESEVKSSVNSVMLVDKMALDVTSSDLNLPVAGQIGEYQIDIFRNSSTIASGLVSCQADNCQVKCTSPKPSVTRVIENIWGHRPTEVSKVMNNGGTIEVRTPMKPSATINIGNVNFENLFVNPSQCKLSIAMTFGCVGCVSKPYAVVQAYDIKTEGILDFESNCTFDRKYLSCNREPYTIELDQTYDNCVIYVNRLNITLNLKMKYNFVGEVSKIEYSHASETYSGVLKSVVTSESFINSVANTLTTCAILSTVLTIIIQVVKVWTAHRVENEAAHIP